MTFVTLTRPRSGDFATLSREVRRAGLLERRRVSYLVKMVLNLAVFATAWVVFVAIGDSWWQLLTAVFFAFMFTQLAFIGHDAGHKQIFRTRRGNDAVGYLHYLRKQVLTSRNVCGRRWVDFVLGGLNFQIEHHLFPSMPARTYAGARHLCRVSAKPRHRLCPVWTPALLRTRPASPAGHRHPTPTRKRTR